MSTKYSVVLADGSVHDYHDKQTAWSKYQSALNKKKHWQVVTFHQIGGTS